MNIVDGLSNSLSLMNNKGLANLKRETPRIDSGATAKHRPPATALYFCNLPASHDPKSPDGSLTPT
jgi:hypothetical protein